MEAALTWSFSFILNFVIILMVGWWIDTFVMFGNRMLQRCSLAHFWLWRSLFNWDRQLDEEHKDKGPGEFWYHISWHWIKHLGRHRTQNDCVNYICCPQRRSYIVSTNIAKGTPDPRVKCSHQEIALEIHIACSSKFSFVILTKPMPLKLNQASASKS